MLKCLLYSPTVAFKNVVCLSELLRLAVQLNFLALLHHCITYHLASKYLYLEILLVLRIEYF